MGADLRMDLRGHLKSESLHMDTGASIPDLFAWIRVHSRLNHIDTAKLLGFRDKFSRLALAGRLLYALGE